MALPKRALIAPAPLDPHLDLRAFSLLKEAGLSHLALRRLSDLLVLQNSQAGETLLKPKEITSSLYFVSEGAYSVFTDSAKPELIASLTAGDVFGESFFVVPSASDVSITAETASRVLILTGASYDQFAIENPAAALALQAALTRSLDRQLKKAQTHLRLVYELLKASSQHR